MKEELMKSLVSLIDESLAEIEELKKSDRFSASEVKLDGPGSDGIAGKPANGSLGKEEDKKKDKKDDEDEEDEAEKAEGQNRQADPNGGHHQAEKSETGMPEGTAKKAEGQAEKGEGQNRQADPNGGSHKMDKAEDKKEDKDEKDEDKKKDKKEDMEEKMKKSAEEANTLLKSYVDQRLSPIEEQLKAIATLVKELGDAPVPAKGQTYRSVEPLKKSDEGSSETALTKGALVDRLFELKKSGTRVDSTDIASAELAKGADLVKIAQKYNIK